MKIPIETGLTELETDLLELTSVINLSRGKGVIFVSRDQVEFWVGTANLANIPRILVQKTHPSALEVRALWLQAKAEKAEGEVCYNPSEINNITNHNTPEKTVDNNRKLKISLEDHILKIIKAYNENKTISYASKQTMLDPGMEPNNLTFKKGTCGRITWDFANIDFWIEPVRTTYFQVLYFKNESDGMQVGGKRATLEQARKYLVNYTRPSCIIETVMVDDNADRNRDFTTTVHNLLDPNLVVKS